MTEVWVLVDIGCIECGCENDEPVIGVFSTEVAAQEALAKKRAAYQENYEENQRRGYEIPFSESSYGITGSDSQVRMQRCVIT